MGLLAGASRIDITPDPGIELMGYGARRGVASGVHDPLRARALCLSHAETAKAVVLVVADLCLITTEQAATVRQRIAKRSGVDAAAILISCTHTHSGPDTGLTARMSRREEPAYTTRLLEDMAEAGVRAWDARQPAQLLWTRAEARIGRNRRREGGPLDPEILVLQVMERGGAPLTTLFHHACHGTVLGHDNLEISADWPGAAAARIEAETGAVALFLLGAHADIDPRTRGLMDLAIDGQSLGLGFDAVSVLGGEVAEAVLAALDRATGGDAAPELGALRTAIPLAVHPGETAQGAREEHLARSKRELATLLGLPEAGLPRLSELLGVAHARVEGLPVAEARERLARVRLYLRDKTAPFWLEGRTRPDVEAQLLRIGDAALLALPLEPTTAVGLDWKARVQRRLPLGGVAGIANGWLRYLPHPEDLAGPRAHHAYEVYSSLLAPGACERLLDAGEQMLEATLRG